MEPKRDDAVEAEPTPRWMPAVRFTNWDSVVIAVLMTVAIPWVLLEVSRHPEWWDRGLKAKLFILASPAVLVGVWVWPVFYVEFGRTIGFRRLWGRRDCGWEQLTSVRFESELKLMFFVIPVRRRYLHFALDSRGEHRTYRFLVSRRRLRGIVDILERHRPDLASAAGFPTE